MSIGDLYPVVDDEGFRGFLAELLEDGYLDEGSPAAGISRQVVASGSEHLTEKQMAVFERHVLREYGEPPTCPRCQCGVEWSDAMYAMDNDGYHPTCHERSLKDD